MTHQPTTPALPALPTLGLDSETMLRLAIQGARVGTWASDLGNGTVYWSPELEHIFGLEPGSFEGTREAFVQRVHSEDRDLVREAVDRAIEKRTDYSVEFRFRHASGEWRWMDSRGRAVYDEDGRGVSVYGVGIDITDRKRAEQARAHLAAIVESSDDAIISKTLDGIITTWNVGASRLFGYTAEEIIGQSILTIIPRELQHEESQILERLRRGERIEHYETTRCTRDGQQLRVSLTVSPVRDSSGRIVGASKIARNITERERLLESERAARSHAERLSRIKDEFLATLSHELRTPLNAILGWSALLRQHTVLPEERTRGLETIERNARVQAQIINDLLDMSRIVSGKLHLDVQPIYLQDVISAAIETVRPSAEARHIRLTTLLDSTIGRTRGDPNRLQQVLWNLLTNAVKFTPQGGRIQVLLERVSSHVEITVADSGVGIKAEFLPYVFDRFRQADASTTRRFGGLGLGLSIVRNLVEMHGGTVSVRSPGENQGTTFTIALPLLALDSEPARRSQAPSADVVALEDIELPMLNKATILLVDDEVDTRLLMQRILEDRGARVLTAASASEALATLAGNGVDLLVSDIGMPGTDGYQLIRQVRALDGRRTGPLPAIAVTAYARPEDRQRSLLAGYQAHISKPLEARELIAAIASLLRIAH
ncbi:MAG TPA: PAS domain S-box protein [Steroidobacteraceae bacterium]|nr:PAS domain S-box protein [Steroidobacteraceae bacterium]